MNLDDVYPRNCGEEGPVDLLRLDPGALVDVERAGDHYLVRHVPEPEANDGSTAEFWAVDRCGESPVLVDRGQFDPSPALGAAADFLLSCDETTGEMDVLDPQGEAPPRRLFDAVEFCRVVPLGDGLAAQERGTGTVWFHPDPSDPDVDAILVTDAGLVADPNWPAWTGMRFDVRGRHPFGVDIRRAGDDLVFVGEDGTVFEFSPETMQSRPLTEPGMMALDVIGDGDRLIFKPEGIARGFVVDRRTDEVVDFCCFDDLQPVKQVGDWLIRALRFPPLIPTPDEWTNLHALHVASGRETTIVGPDGIWIYAPVGPGAALAGVFPDVSGDEVRQVITLETGQRRTVDMPGADVWPSHDGIGVFALQVDDDPRRSTVWHLAGPDADPVEVVDAEWILFATDAGRIVAQDAGLVVLLPSGERVDVDPDAVEIFGTPAWSSNEPWPVHRDEVVYVAEDAEGWILRRTTLP